MFISLITSLNYAIIITYKSLSILVSPPKPKVVATIDGIITGTILGGILYNFFYYNYSNNYIIKPYRKYYGRFVNGLGI